MTLSMFATVDGVEVEVHATGFDGDPSVGLEMWPEQVWATRLDNGEPCELSDEQVEQFGIKLTEAYLEQE